MSVCNNNINIDKSQTEVEEKFVFRKLQSMTLSKAYYFLGEDSKGHRVDNCGTFLEFHINEEESKLAVANFCKDRLCPMCNWRRSKKIFAQVSSVMDVAEKDGFRFLFLTLTVKNCKYHNLQESINCLLEGWSNLRHKKAFKDRVCGSFRTLEITVNRERGEFHPHLHIILAVRPDYFHKAYLSQREWGNMWQECCRLEYNPVIDIRAVKSGNLDVTEGVQTGSQEMRFHSAIKEVSKYIAKGTDYLDEDDFEETLVRVSHLLDGISHRKLNSFTGVFKDIARKLKLDDMEHGDLVHTETEIRSDVAYMVVRYSWNSGIHSYDQHIDFDVINGICMFIATED